MTPCGEAPDPLCRARRGGPRTQSRTMEANLLFRSALVASILGWCKGVLVDAAMGVTSARVSGFAVRRGRGHGRLTVRGCRGPDSGRDPQLHRHLLTRDSTSQELTS